MYSLKEHFTKPILIESTKNSHMEHVEDGILTGLADAHISVNFIDSVADILSGGKNNVSVTTKWDGSPAIVCGVNPDNNLFFVGTKAVFAKRTPKIIYSKKHIEKYYKESPGVARQLEVALAYLPQLKIQGVLQGDMMFSRGEVEAKTIQGRQYITFRPNTLLYAVPAETDLAERIQRAKMGIIFHTSYSGDTLYNMQSSFKLNLGNLSKTNDVWYDDASLSDESGSAALSENELKVLHQYINRAEAALEKLDTVKYEELVANKTLIGMIRMFTNGEVRTGRLFHKDFIGKFKLFVQQRIDQEKTRDTTKEKKKEQYTSLLDRLSPTIEIVLQFQDNVNRAKLLLIGKLQQIDSIKTFIPTGNEQYKESKQEGYVAVDRLTNKAVKFVDRLEFSRTNLLRQR